MRPKNKGKLFIAIVDESQSGVVTFLHVDQSIAESEVNRLSKIESLYIVGPEYKYSVIKIMVLRVLESRDLNNKRLISSVRKARSYEASGV